MYSKKLSDLNHTLAELPLDKACYVIFDLETTGGNPEKSSIIEIYAKKVCAGQPKGEYYSMARPKQPIPRIVQKMTGIHNDMVHKAPPAAKIYPKIAKFIHGSILVSHNTISDIRHLRHLEKQHSGKPLLNFFLCTHLLCEKLFPAAPDKSLSGVASYLGKSSDCVHRAKEDTELTEFVHQHILEQLRKRNIHTVREAILFQNDIDSTKRLRHLIATADIEALPQKPGYIALYTHSRTPLGYIPTPNARTAMRKLDNYDRVSKTMLRHIVRATAMEYHPTPSFADALYLATQQCHQHQLEIPALAWCGSPFLFICIDRTANTQLRIRVGDAHPESFKVFGPVFDHKQTKSELQAIATELMLPGSGKAFDFDPHLLHNLLTRITPKTPFLDRLLSEVGASLQDFQLVQHLKNIAQILTRRPYARFSNPHLSDFLGQNGILSIRHNRGRKRVSLFALVAGVPIARCQAPLNWQEWLHTSEAGQDLLQQFHTACQQKSAEAPPSTQEAELRRAFLWLRRSQAPRLQWDRDFYPL